MILFVEIKSNKVDSKNRTKTASRSVLPYFLQNFGSKLFSHVIAKVNFSSSTLEKFEGLIKRQGELKKDGPWQSLQHLSCTPT